MFPKQGSIEFDSSNKKTVNHLLYDIDNENWCGLGCNSDGSFAVRVGVSDIGKHVFKVKTNGSITFDNKSLVTNSDLPIIESHHLNPNGNDIFTIQLDYPTTDELINVSMSGNNIDYPSIVTAYMTSSNTLAVKLSKAYNRLMRVNVLYYKSK